MPAGGSCLLGALNLSAFVANPFTDEASFNSGDFYSSVQKAVDALNEVLDEGRKLHPLLEQSESVRNWRQIGLGIFGLADCLIKLGIVYGSEEANSLCETIARTMFLGAVKQSEKRSKKYDSYPMFDEAAINSSQMLKSLDYRVSGLNNSQLLTIAPTGSISTMIGVSGGIEPIFANSYTRRTQSLHGKTEDVFYKVYTPIVKEYMEKHNVTDEKDLPKQFVTAPDIKPYDRIKCQAAWQKWIDASISSTINLPNEATVEDIKDIYINAWKSGLKGVTVYRAGCAREGVLIADDTKDKIKNKPEEALYDHIVPVSRKTIGTTNGCTYCKKSACGTLYITINKDSDGNVVESFVNTSKGGICQSNINAVNRMISLNLRSGVKVGEVVDQLKGITCPACVKVIGKGEKKLDGISCPDIIAKTLLEFYGSTRDEAKNEPTGKEKTNGSVIGKGKLGMDRCPDCGASLNYEGGCVICPECGWSRCS